MLAPLLLLWFLADPNPARALLQKGLVALQHGQLAEAQAALEQGSQLEPQNLYIWASLAETYWRLKEPQKAAAAAETAEKGSAGNPLVAHALAMYYSEAGNRAHAALLEEQYRAATWESAKTDPQAAYAYVQLLLRREEFRRAAEVTTVALSAHPNDAQLLLALGVARYGQRRFEDSVIEFLQVIRIDPGIEQPYVFLGKMLDQAGSHLDEITKAYEAWASADPNNATAQLLLAKALLATSSRSPQAETLLRHSIALDSRNWEAHYQLGVLLAEERNYEEAASELSRSIELNPKEAMPHYHLARVYDRLGQPDRAKAERELHRQLASPKSP